MNKGASGATLNALKQADTSFYEVQQKDFIVGNIKTRQRIIAQYAVAGRYSGLVIGAITLPKRLGDSYQAR
jgi:NAD+ synthase